jgi:hypothetical protein
MSRYKIVKIPEISDVLITIHQICREKRIEFVLESEYGEPNKIYLDESTRMLSINLTDFKDVNLVEELNKIKEKIKIIPL